jgi:hypothetical protein
LGKLLLFGFAEDDKESAKTSASAAKIPGENFLIKFILKLLRTNLIEVEKCRDGVGQFERIGRSSNNFFCPPANT